MNRLALCLSLTMVLMGCQKATPRSTSSDRYGAQRIRTLTHDEDLTQGSASVDSTRVLEAIASPSRSPAR